MRVVTDSTSDLPNSVVQEFGIAIVPPSVNFGENESCKDRVLSTADDFYERLVSSPELPKISQTSIGGFVKMYRKVAKALTHMEHHTRSFAPIEHICVLYSTTPDLAVGLARKLKDLLPDSGQPMVSRFGPVLDTCVGPGAIGIWLLRSTNA